MGIESMILMDPAIEDSGPFNGIITTNLTPDGPVIPKTRISEFNLTEQGVSPTGGINYINQAEGGVIGPRGDIFAGPLSGIRGFRQRFQPFNGARVQAALIVGERNQGNVGLSNRENVGRRANSSQSTNLPDQGDVVASFTNPALSRVINKLRGR